ncbi:hypothetical protein ABZV93_27010 [Actinopolymorpha sp. NPDC004070]|uniref:hypothetical protein n=1 Tax=Actinopolymorpha sp. NPDC004070 TaxID=3154548 RepID=UPI0033BD6117
MPDHDPAHRDTCPTCGWPMAELTSPADSGGPADPGGPGELLSRHGTSAGTVTYVRCVCGGLLVLVAGGLAGGVAGDAGPWENDQGGAGHRGTTASRGAA